MLKTDRIEAMECFLKSCKVSLKIEKCSSDEFADTKTHDYRYIITRKGKQLSGTFSKKSDGEPTAYDILSSLPSYEPELDLWDFAKNHGYQINSQRDYDAVLSIYKEYCYNWRGVNRLFGDVLDELWEML